MPQTASQPESTHDFRPLCVDLDGTLVKWDTLIDSLAGLIADPSRASPKLPGRLLRGKAAFKEFVTDPFHWMSPICPITASCCSFSNSSTARAALLLATGANLVLARRVAAHLGIFRGVLGSDGATNLTGDRKLDGMRTRLGGEIRLHRQRRPDLPLLATN